MGRLLISADSHVMEPLDLWTSGLPEHLRAHGPRVEPRDGVACLLVEDTVVRRLPALAKVAGPAGGLRRRREAPHDRVLDQNARHAVALLDAGAVHAQGLGEPARPQVERLHHVRVGRDEEAAHARARIAAPQVLST